MKKNTTEGQASIIIDDAAIVTRKLEAFYNPKMKLNRDISILLLQARKQKDMKILLPLAGTGVRGVRFLQEVKGINTLITNDFDNKAVQYIKENLKKNDLENDKRVDIRNEDANQLLTSLETGFDYIDVDPFGSPNFLIENALRRVKTGGVLAVTATDTGALAGTYVNAGRVKYWATPALCPQQHETGLRILARKVIMHGMHQDKQLTPLLSYHHEHYYRIFFLVQKGRVKAGTNYEHIHGHFHHCKACAAQWMSKNKNESCKECGSAKLAVAGPLYTGRLHAGELVQSMAGLTADKKISKLLSLALEDLKLDIVGYYDTHAICDILKKRTLSLKTICEQIQKKGFKTALVSTNPYGVRTNAPYKEVIDLFS